MSPMELSEVLELDINFVDGTKYTPIITKHDAVRNFPSTIVLIFGNDAQERVIINRSNVTFISYRRVKRLIPARPYVPIDARKEQENAVVSFEMED